MQRVATRRSRHCLGSPIDVYFRVKPSVKRQLDFALLDDFELARQRRGSVVLNHLSQVGVRRLGPLVELCMQDRMCSTEHGALDVLPASEAVDLLKQTSRQSLTSTSTGTYANGSASGFGVIGTNRNPRDEDAVDWLQFCHRAQAAAERAVPKILAQGLVGAMREMEENIHLHSERAQDGIVAFRGNADEFEFVVADSGVGVLQGLRSAARYAYITDAGTALKTALSDGQSRLLDQDLGRGFGFHDLFVSLANLSGELRFRSDDHALTIDGSGPALPQSRLAQKARLQGFVISIVCTLKSAAQPQVH